jgi:diguanylate cyclase (GGDEF)-like protein
MNGLPDWTPVPQADGTPASLLLDSVDDAILVVTPDLKPLYANRAAVELAGHRHLDETLDQLDAVAMVHRDDLGAVGDAMASCRADGRSKVRFRLLLPDAERPVEVTLTDHTATPAIGGIVACFRNLEHEVALQESLDRERQLDRRILAALTDQLTGLPTRRLFLDRLQDALAEAAVADEPLAVFFLDLDGFKAINDALGHSAGDAMLRSTTEHLLRVHPDPDHWGRIGGDEFALYVTGHDAETALALAGELARSVKKRVALGGPTTHTSASLGISVIAPGAADAEAAVRQADIAMYEGKRAGRDSITLFAPEMERRVIVRAELEAQLRSMVTGAGPTVVYQPIFDLRTGAVHAVEALARWHSPTRGPINPDRFIGIAEELGMIGRLDRHVLRTACRDLRPLNDPATGEPLRIAINSSTFTLTDERFAADVLLTLDETGVSIDRLLVEVTETAAVEDDPMARRQLAVLREAGVPVALDDFGTGHSSLAQLEHLEIDIVKIDRSFLRGVPDSPRRLRYLETIIAMASALHLEVVIEGVERIEQARALAARGVRFAQGYLLAAPCGVGRLLEQIEAAEAILAEHVARQPPLDLSFDEPLD